MTTSALPSDPTYQQLVGQLLDFCRTETNQEAGLRIERHADGRWLGIRIFPKLHPQQGQVIETLWWTGRVFEVQGYAAFELANDADMGAFLKDLGRRRTFALMKSELGELNTTIDPTYGYLRPHKDGISSPDDVCLELFVSEMVKIASAADGADVQIKALLSSQRGIKRADYDPAATYNLLDADGYQLGSLVITPPAGAALTVKGKRLPLPLLA